MITDQNLNLTAPQTLGPAISNRHYLPIRNEVKSFPSNTDTRSNRQWILALPFSRLPKSSPQLP
jgi:hypothetical protein